MRIALAVLLVAVLALAWRLNSTSGTLGRLQETISQQQQQIQTLTTALADRSKQEGLALQEKCAAQAEKVFLAFGYKFASKNLDADILQSHFNSRLNKCFMTVDANSYQKGQQFSNRVLLDAYEQREYAEYTWMSDKVKKYWEVKPFACKEIPLMGDEQFCNSDDEYKAIVRRYME
jgi:hypothetical protein